MKCLYKIYKDEDALRCDKLAEYVYLGKSYCKKHMEVRGKEVD